MGEINLMQEITLRARSRGLWLHLKIKAWVREELLNSELEVVEIAESAFVKLNLSADVTG